MRTNPTPPEARLWYNLRAKRFEATKFRFQTVIAPYIVDFTSRSAMLAIELDGESHAHQQSHDERRDRFLEAEGFRILRFPNNEVMLNLEGVLYAIAAAISSSPSLRLRGEGKRPGESRGSGGEGHTG
jgi:adenine-specific DNA-methyltransferase